MEMRCIDCNIRLYKLFVTSKHTETILSFSFVGFNIIFFISLLINLLNSNIPMISICYHISHVLLIQSNENDHYQQI